MLKWNNAIRPLWTVIIAVALCTAANAQNVLSADDAMAVANGFFPKSRGTGQVGQTLAYTGCDSTTQHPFYYVFNRGDDDGWVIICADGRSKKILGYNTSGHFDITTAPPEMKTWLRDCSEQIKDLNATPDELLEKLDKITAGQAVLSKAIHSKSANDAVSPLLGEISYGQNYPYNAMTPVMYGQNCVTGCVATSQVMVLRYWQYPTVPTGKSHSYNLYGQQIGTNYDTYYDWSHMLPYYKDVDATEQEVDAVAKLMFDVGVSSNMNYTTTSSSAATFNALQRLSTYFDYSPDMIAYQRRNFTEADYEYLLKCELSAGRPVVFEGFGGGAGHCFVCDGYDSNDLFHINWGWEGLADGYYSISNLSPSQWGTGGGMGTYNDNVSFVGGIRPNGIDDGTKAYLMAIDGVNYHANSSLGQTLTMSLNRLTNVTLLTIQGSVGFALYKGGRLVRILGQARFEPMMSQNYWGQFNVNVTWPRTLQSGKYHVVAVFKVDGDDAWRPIVSGACSTVDMSVSGRHVYCKPNYAVHYIDIPQVGGEAPDDEQGIDEFDEDVAPDGEDFGYDEEPILDEDTYYGDDDETYSDEDDSTDEETYSDEDDSTDEETYSDDEDYTDEETYSDGDNTDEEGSTYGEDTDSESTSIIGDIIDILYGIFE